jgi:ATP-dependent RNA helicase DDX3X
MRNAQHATPPPPQSNGYVISFGFVYCDNQALAHRTGWNELQASPRRGSEPLRGGPPDKDSKDTAFAGIAFNSPTRGGSSASDWAGRPPSNGWTAREPRGDSQQRDSSGFGAWRNGLHVVGPRNPRMEKELFGDPTDPSKQHTGINFEKYDDIPVEATGAGVPEPVTAFTNPPLDPVLLENIAFARYTTPTPVQKYSIPIVATNRDLMACAQVRIFYCLLCIR